MDVINKLRIGFKKRRAKFNTKLHDIPEQGKFKNKQILLNQSLEDLLEDELFLVPREVLDMNSSRVREDLSSMARREKRYKTIAKPDKSLTLMEDMSGIFMARASQGCSTLWICKSLTFCLSSQRYLYDMEKEDFNC